MIKAGTYVLVRSRDDGVKVGYLVERIGREVLLREARTVHRWRGEDRLECIEVAHKKGEIDLSMKAEGLVLMLEACGIIEVPERMVGWFRSTPAKLGDK